MPSQRRQYFVVPVFIALCSLVGGLFSARGVKAASSLDEATANSSKAFTSVYDLVEKNFAEPVKPDKAIYNGAIPGMLRELDPHSNFFDPKAYRALRDDQQGHYYGVGMTVQAHASHVVVVAPFTGSPAYKAGLRPGDVIIMVNDKSTEGLGVSEVADLLKGPKGTTVQVVVSREGVEKPITFNIVRDEIARASVPDAFWLKPVVAYLKIDQFNENTSKEMTDKLAQLGEKEIKGLVLDLRENPGGLLNEGIEVAGHFLKKNETVVSVRGRAQPNKTYTARSDNGGKDYPIVVIVNRYTASAAEIVSGALQDHDRAWIFGETTFGKGLVQQVYPLSDNTGLALTTAHYYTPSGRLIQRDYSNISFLDYYYHTNLDQRNTQDVKMTDSGRTVYGGGGITPDEKYTVPKLNKFQIQMIRKYAFYDFSARYFAGRKDATLPKGWQPDEKLVNDFHDFLMKNNIPFTDADFIANHDWIKQQLYHELAITGFGFDESEKIRIEQDPEVLKAMESLPKAKALVDNAKKMMVQRFALQEQAAVR